MTATHEHHKVNLKCHGWAMDIVDEVECLVNMYIIDLGRRFISRKYKSENPVGLSSSFSPFLTHPDGILNCTCHLGLRGAQAQAKKHGPGAQQQQTQNKALTLLTFQLNVSRSLGDTWGPDGFLTAALQGSSPNLCRKRTPETSQKKRKHVILSQVASKSQSSKAHPL